MSEPVTHKLDYSELERLYTEAFTCTPRCSHADSELTADEQGCYTMHCNSCGVHGYANEESARRLGWIE